MSKAYKVIETDNFGGDFPAERFATPYAFTRDDAVWLSNWLNEVMGGPDGPRYWRPVPSDYQLRICNESACKLISN